MAGGPLITDRLDSWKEIAAYIRKTERTVMRWEQTRDFPVHRVPGGQRQAVYARRHEIDAWLKQGDGKTGVPEKFAQPALVNGAETPSSQPAPQTLLRSQPLRAV